MTPPTVSDDQKSNEAQRGFMCAPPSQATARQWNMEGAFRARVNAMLHQIRKGDAEKAAIRAREVGHAALRILALRGE